MATPTPPSRPCDPGRGSIWSSRSASATSRRRSCRPYNGETAGTATPAASCGIPTSSGKAPRWPKRWKHCGKPPQATSTCSSPGKPEPARSCSPAPCTPTACGRPARSSPWTAPPCPKRWWRRICSGTHGARSPGQTGRAKGFSPPPTTARCSSTRWANCPSPYRAPSCGRWSCAASAPSVKCAKWKAISASSPQPTGISTTW